jgi:chemotaxis signal transduction protein
MTRPIPWAEFAKVEFTLDTCWKRIGIHGDKTCPELPQYVHCRDCPTFSLAAAALLDRELPGELLPLPPVTLPAAAETECATIFRVGTEWFALPTRAVDEIVSARRVHSLPHKRNPALLGLVNIRGELVICAAIAPLLLGIRGEAAQGRMIVVCHPGGRLACPVDEVQHTHHYASDKLEPAPATVSRSASSLTRGLFLWQGRMVACLDEQALFDALGRSFA